MAAFNTFLIEEQLQCSVCLDIFTKPVSTPCGHNFCMACLNKYWDNSQNCICPLCKKEYSKRPQLCVNTFISNLAAQFKESLKVKSSSHTKEPPAAQGHVPCDVCTDQTQMALTSCLDCGMSFCATHLEHHKIAVKLKQHKLIDAVKNLEIYICQRHQRPLELFCRDDEKCVCLFCTEGEHKSHNTISLEEESAEKKIKLQKTQAEFQVKIQDRLKKIEEINHSLDLNKKNIDEEKDDSSELFRCLMSSSKRMQADLLMVLEKKQKGLESQAEELVQRLKQEITELKRSDTKLEKLLVSEDHVHFLQACLTMPTPSYTNNLDKMKINSSLIVKDMMKDLLDLQQSVSATAKKMSELTNLDYQREEIKKLLNTPLQKGDTWYLVDSKWFNRWKKYVGFDSSNMASLGDQMFYPGRMDNSQLLKDSLSIREHLLEHLDYNLLPKEVWGKLLSWYGLSEHQKPIARKVVEEGLFAKSYKVEVFFTELRLCEFSNMDQGISRHFSKVETVACIEKEMRKIFNIPDGKETRLWNIYLRNLFKPLDCPSKTIQEAGLFQKQTVFIEQRNEDGTWPQRHY
ncbi:E3 ubiquitin/ISG15 ligase TRIM25-like [Tachysurus fulvidraco]|uniref:E3 ubiquitin/ISG15 ligase TRIM25-like n=1 Tax=Tachysurus fulvidraco TaxID=1234273 RepID=UPI001FEEC163|nr:E3 ubiquitin/ISG15 ligase TRIM25-like [Tachysurus fulvidraco]